jgi:predicted RND superfamily exporter protein
VLGVILSGEKRMKTGALIALIIAIMGMILNLGNYMFYLIGRPSPIITQVTWPVQIIIGSLPVIVLSIAILSQKSDNS